MKQKLIDILWLKLEELEKTKIQFIYKWEEENNTDEKIERYKTFSEDELDEEINKWLWWKIRKKFPPLYKGDILIWLLVLKSWKYVKIKNEKGFKTCLLIAIKKITNNWSDEWTYFDYKMENIKNDKYIGKIIIKWENIARAPLQKFNNIKDKLYLSETLDKDFRYYTFNELK